MDANAAPDELDHPFRLMLQGRPMTLSPCLLEFTCELRELELVEKRYVSWQGRGQSLETAPARCFQAIVARQACPIAESSRPTLPWESPSTAARTPRRPWPRFGQGKVPC